MKIVRFINHGHTYLGKLVQDQIFPLAPGDFAGPFKLSDVKLLPPATPTKVVAVGLNYVDHAREMNLTVPDEPLLFLKPASSVIGHGDSIIIPSQSSRVDYEAELAIVIGTKAKDVSSKDASNYILGYTCLNDVTARDLQAKDGQWTRAKGFDTFCPIGPWIETEVFPSDMEISLILNGKTKQHSRTSQLIFDCFQLVEFISSVMTLYPGDVIATGTTSGIGPVADGDIVEVKIEGIGSLINKVSK